MTFYHSLKLLENFDIDPVSHVDSRYNEILIEFKEGNFREKKVKTNQRVYTYRHLVFTVAHKDLKYPCFIVFCDTEFDYYYVVRREKLADVMKNRVFERYTNVTLKCVQQICEARLDSISSLKDFLRVIKK